MADDLAVTVEQEVNPIIVDVVLDGGHTHSNMAILEQTTAPFTTEDKNNINSACTKSFAIAMAIALGG